VRQEVLKGTINVGYTASKDMTVDGLTKALQNENFDQFQSQMRLVDVSERLSEKVAQHTRADKPTEPIRIGDMNELKLDIIKSFLLRSAPNP
jgi:hypothetical protein